MPAFRDKYAPQINWLEDDFSRSTAGGWNAPIAFLGVMHESVLGATVVLYAGGMSTIHCNYFSFHLLNLLIVIYYLKFIK